LIFSVEQLTFICLAADFVLLSSWLFPIKQLTFSCHAVHFVLSSSWLFLLSSWLLPVTQFTLICRAVDFSCWAVDIFERNMEQLILSRWISSSWAPLIIMSREKNSYQ
jgi:hypothetical protein